MLAAIWLAGVFLGTAISLTGFLQTLYLESLRLRSREAMALTFFKAEIEDRLNLKGDDGALTFSLLKHFALLLLSILILAGFAINGFTGPVLSEAVVTSWIVMVASSYIVPQILYRRTTGHWMLPLAPLIRAAALIVRPLVGLLNFLQSLLAIASEQTAAEEAASSTDNIEALISAGAEEGLIEEDDRKLIQNVVEFGDKIVREVMTPRPNIVAMRADAPLEELRQLVINEQYSRIPIYEDNIDQIIGFVHVRDMFELEEEERARRSVRQLMRPIRFIPETKPVNDLMREMQQEGAHMAIVVDEYGNTAGLITMEDMVEVILGEIRDEHEPGSDVTEDGNGGYIVSGNFDLSRLDDIVSFRPEEDIESTTVGGLVTEWLGRVPAAGESVERDGIRIEVLASDELRVERVRVSRSKVPHPLAS